MFPAFQTRRRKRLLIEGFLILFLLFAMGITAAVVAAILNKKSAETSNSSDSTSTSTATPLTNKL